MRSETSNTSPMLWLMRTTPRPCSASRRTRSRTWRVCATPSAAVGSSSITTLESQSTAFAIATVWRWPPESEATGIRTEVTVRTESEARVRRAACSMSASSSSHDRPRSRPRNMFWTMSKLSQRARSWYTTSMPSLLASVGPWIVTGSPSNSTSPPSIGWMPATHLTSVDLPAPLSPTSAVTSPARTVKSTPCSTCTGPKCLSTPRSCRIGSDTTTPPGRRGCAAGVAGRASAGVVGLLDAELPAGGLRGRDAHLGGLDLALVDHRLDVVLGDQLRGEQHRRHLAVALRVVGAGGGELVGCRLVALGQRGRELGRGVGLLLDRLVDRHVLVAAQDRLQAVRGGVLPGHRDLAVEAVLLQHGDDRACESVVGRDDAVDLAAVLGQQLLEDDAALLVVPVGDRLAGHQLERAGGVERLEDVLLPVVEEGGVVVRRGALDLDHLATGLVLHRVRQALALQLADLHVVERHVVVAGAAEVEAVVVDDRDALRLGLRGDGGTRLAADRGDDEHLHLARDHAVGERGELLLVALGVLDVGLQPRGLHRLREQRLVEALPAGRARGLREDHTGLGAGGRGRGRAPAARARGGGVLATGGERESEAEPRGHKSSPR